MKIITVEMDEPTYKFLLQVVSSISKYQSANQADWKALAERLEASLDEIESETDDGTQNQEISTGQHGTSQRTVL